MSSWVYLCTQPRFKQKQDNYPQCYMVSLVSLLKHNQQVADNRVGNPVITHHFPHTLMNRHLSRLQIRVTQSPRTRTEITTVSPVQLASFVIRERQLHNQRFHQNFLVSFCLRAQMASYTCRRTLQTGVEPFSAYI